MIEKYNNDEPGREFLDESLCRILILEDISIDAQVIEYELKKGGIQCIMKRVETKADFLNAVEQFQPDLILADYILPGFDGLAALHIIQEQYPDVPFILISGSMEEQIAIDAIKKGATDYIFKYHISRLVPSVKRVLRESKEKLYYKKHLVSREKELEARVKDLEKFHSAAIQRELKMIKLKEELSQLKKELNKYKTNAAESREPS